MSQSPFSLDGQVVLVSGAGRGIGRAAAELIAQMGARVAVTARTVAQVEAVAESTREENGQAGAFRADISAIEDHESLLDDIEDTIGPITGLVNVAGVSPILQRGERITPEDYDQIQNINQRGTFFLTRNFASRLIDAERGGSIVTISSVGAEFGLPRQAAYSMTRAAVEAMTKTLAAEWAHSIPAPIRVNCVAPAFIDTPLTEPMPGWYRARVEAHTAMRRLGADDEVAGAVAFLLSDAASYITGTVVPVTGGYGLWSLDPR
ncbi:MAG: SDR family oxidoreductase [Chloroflexi bacterium]|nr:SDR family oxidoreductase [Chloroflexota bacterium]